MINTDKLIEKIKTARVYDVAIKTSLEKMALMSVRLSNNVYIKREDQQEVFSFKIRGAYNKISGLSADQLAKGIIGASAGNHAQGIAVAAARVGIRPTIVMPKTTPDIKVDAVKRLGGEVILHGNTYDDASSHAYKLSAESNATYIHPYDDEDVIAGQGTVAVEIIDQMDEAPYAVFIPVGGGGLISGMAVWLNNHNPNIKIIGVEPDDAPCMYEALKAGERTVLDHVGIFADGVAVKQVGELPFELARDLIDEVILVNTDETCAAIKDIYDESRSIMEPAGALALAGLKKYVARESIADKNLVAVNSGANINFDRLRHVAERAEIGEQKESLFAVTIPERPGSFHEFCHLLGNRGITEFNYRYADERTAHVFAGIQLKNGEVEKQQILDKLGERQFEVVDLSDDELAKQHIRYMVGGRSPSLVNERLYRFEFPERPGALLRFLSCLRGQWNISLFHYRNHGSDYGRVLAGFQVPENELQDFQCFLDELGYTYGNESENPAYRLFLSSAGK
ncbi:MAG: threonine ammonia-lyase, biosynthetic [Bacteroidetes bacterium]|nr:MAG: threonine ammonia-lyase, biosynthetic [Bacteroidota bacterium]